MARAANDESTAHGIAGIGRVVTTAALVMSISFAALIPAHVSFMRMLGLGLTLAVLADATLVRMVLVPGFHPPARTVDMVGAELVGAVAPAGRHGTPATGAYRSGESHHVGDHGG